MNKSSVWVRGFGWKGIIYNPCQSEGCVKGISTNWIPVRNAALTPKPKKLWYP